MNISGYAISKTSFLKFEQCHKAFFLYKNHPYLRDKVSIDKQLTFKRGHDVGYFAQQLFPGGIDVSKEAKGATACAELTAELIKNKTPVIYEATFIYNGVLIMTDILCFVNDHYIAYEVKSSVKISETYLKDAYLQYYVLKNVLPAFEDLFLVTLNPDYVLESTIDARKLFRKRSVKAKADENTDYFAHQISSAHQLLEQNTIPNTAIGTQCFRPYTCDFFGTCWKDVMHENSIFNLPYLDKTKVFEWYNSGIKDIHQLNDALIEKPAALKIKQAFVNKVPIVDRAIISSFLAQVKEPVAAMDMEIWSAAIPQIKGTRPFEQVPFLVCFYDGEKNYSYFSGHEEDKRNLFAQQLIDLSKNYASIIVYDKTMEIGAINALMNLYPAFSPELENLKTKLVDVFDIFLNLAYYTPDFKSNFSLKTVASVLLEGVHYSRISSGLEAMNYYEQYRSAGNDLEKEGLKQELIDYCNTDTLATFKLVSFLKKLIA